MAKKTCEHCGASMVQYRHNFSEGLAEGLLKLHQHGSAVNIKELGLDRNSWDNFQKLRYWHLVRQVTNEGGGKKSGVWTITETGAAFIEGQQLIKKCVITYRGQTVGFQGKDISFADVHPSYEQRPDYAAGAIPA